MVSCAEDLSAEEGLMRQVEDGSAQAGSHPEGQHTTPRRRQFLWCVAVALLGVMVGALGLRYVGVLREALWTSDAQDARQSETKTRAAASVRTDEAGRGESASAGHDEKRRVLLTDNQIQQLGIEIAVAQGGRLLRHLTLPGTIVLNTDRLVHIVPRIPGVVRDVRKHLGDSVRAGDILAVIDSRELADAKAAYLAASARVALAEETFARKKDLWENKISAIQDYLTAKQSMAEARLELRAARHKLSALGISEASLQQLASQPDTPLTRYEIVAPSAGTVIEKHLTVGEFLKDDTEAFLVADLSTVWVHLNVTSTDLPLIRTGQRATITAGSLMPAATSTISYIGPLVSEETRTVLTRVVLPNPDGRWRPGLFVTALVAVDETVVPVLVPKTALQMLDGQPSIFVQTSEGFVPRLVMLGQSNETHVEITAGLQPGEPYASTQTFLLKAELGKPKDMDD
jgi:cobalt-zinc-cadmium efflux system membrane fusion protein